MQKHKRHNLSGPASEIESAALFDQVWYENKFVLVTIRCIATSKPAKTWKNRDSID